MKKRVDDHREPLLDDAIEIREDPSATWSHASKSDFNQWPHVFNLTNCIVGVSVLAMPYCLQQCGILLGTVLIALCSVLTKVTCHLLYKGAIITRRRSYEALALYAFGSGGRRLVEMLMLLFLMSSIVSFLVVIGDIGPHVLADYLQLQAPTQRLRILVMVFVLLFVIFPLSLIRNLDSLSVLSSVTVFFYFIFVVRMLVECVPMILDGSWTLDVTWWRYEGMLNTLPIISMALSCQTQMFCVADCIKDPATEKMDSIVSGAVNLCSAIYAAVGVFGYVAFHDKQLHGDILLYLNPSLLTQSLKLMFMLSIAISVPLMLFPCRNACHNLFLRSSSGDGISGHMSPLAFLGLTLAILSLDMLVAILVPNVEFVLGLTGALIGSLVTIIIPALLFIEVCPPGKANNWLLLYAKVAVVIGALMLVGSTWAVLHTERQSTVVDVIIPKQVVDDKVVESAIDVPEKSSLFNGTSEPIGGVLNEKEVEQKKEEIGKEAKKILDEMREQRKEQDKMIKEQQQIVKELNEHHNMHVEDEKRRADQSVEEASPQKRDTELGEEASEVVEDGGGEVEKVEGDGLVREEQSPERQDSIETKTTADSIEKDLKLSNVVKSAERTQVTVKPEIPKAATVPVTETPVQKDPVKREVPKNSIKPEQSPTQTTKSPQATSTLSNPPKVVPKLNNPPKAVPEQTKDTKPPKAVPEQTKVTNPPKAVPEQTKAQPHNQNTPSSPKPPQTQRAEKVAVTKGSVGNTNTNSNESKNKVRVSNSQPSAVNEKATAKKEESIVVKKRDVSGQTPQEKGKVEKREAEVKLKGVPNGKGNQQTTKSPPRD